MITEEKFKLKDGWYISTNNIIHYVKNDKYLCNRYNAKRINTIPCVESNSNPEKYCGKCIRLKNNIHMNKQISTKLDDKTLEALEELVKYYGLADKSKAVRLCIIKVHKIIESIPVWGKDSKPPLSSKVDFDEFKRLLEVDIKHE